MGMLYVGLSVVSSTLMWPVNRWAGRSGADTEAFGFWIGLWAALISGVATVITGQRLDLPVLWGLGALVGVSFGFGYCIALMRCLATGPLGPSAVMNNMGMLWPVVVGAAWLAPHRMAPVAWVGLALVVASLGLYGLSRPTGSDARKASLRWAAWGVVAWVCAGVSMTAQLAASIWAPGQSFALVFTSLSSTAVFLLVYTRVRGRPLVRRRLVAAGAMQGVLQVVSVSTVQLALQTLHAELVYPFAIGLPIVLALLMGRLFYRERIDAVGWVASVLGVAGLVALSVAG